MFPVLESFPPRPWITFHLKSTLVFMQQYHYFKHQAPCFLPYVKTFKRNPANIRWSPLGSGLEKWWHSLSSFIPFSFSANSSSFLPHRHSSDARHLPPKFLKPPRSPPLQRKNWRYDGFSFVPPESSKLPYIPISMHSCQGVRLWWKCLTRGMC